MATILHTEGAEVGEDEEELGERDRLGGCQVAFM